MNLLSKLTKEIINDYMVQTDILEEIKQSYKLESDTKKVMELVNHYLKCSECELK